MKTEQRQVECTCDASRVSGANPSGIERQAQAATIGMGCFPMPQYTDYRPWLLLQARASSEGSACECKHNSHCIIFRILVACPLLAQAGVANILSHLARSGNSGRAHLGGVIVVVASTD
jgi:hypothetical protein